MSGEVGQEHRHSGIQRGIHVGVVSVKLLKQRVKILDRIRAVIVIKPVKGVKEGLNVVSFLKMRRAEEC